MCISRQVVTTIRALLDGEPVFDDDRELVRAYLHSMAEPAFNPDDEAAFRLAVGEIVNNVRILQVSHHRPATGRHAASALVVGENVSPGGERDICTFVLM